MIGGLLKQIITARALSKKLLSVNDIIHSLREGQKQRKDLSLEESCQFLIQALNPFSRVYLCVDALDECREDYRRILLRSLRDLGKVSRQYPICVYLTGRPHMEDWIQRNHDIDPELFSTTLQASPDDIRAYVLHKIEEDTNQEAMNNELRREIVENIVESSAAMFLLPALQIHAVLQHATVSSRRKALKTMPRELDDAFGAIIDRISNQGDAKSKLAMSTLSWVFLTKRPLKPEELCHAPAVDLDDESRKTFDWENIPSVRSLTEVCLGLIIIDQQTSSIRLVHKSLQDYFERQNLAFTIFQTGDSRIARTCLKYMGFIDTTVRDMEIICDHDGTSLLGSDNYCRDKTRRLMFQQRLINFPFLSYAICQWGHHAKRQTDKAFRSLATDLFVEKYSSCAISKNIHYWSLFWFTTSVLEYPPLHIFAYFGTDQLARDYIDGFSDSIHFKDENELPDTPLSLAVKYGHESFVRLLFEKGAKTECYDFTGRTPLSHAVTAISTKTIKLLLEHHADVQSRDSNGRMPLCYAAEAGNLEKAEILLEYNADIRLKDNQGRCPLLRAASAGQYKTIRMLLKRGADIHQADNYGQTALHRAAAGGQDALRLVLELKVLDINSRDRDNRTALFLAAKTDRVDCVRILLEQDGIDLDSLDNDGCTPLSGAVVSPYGRGDSTPLLLKKGANPEIKDKNGRTTLSLAIEHLESHNPIVNLLLERKEVDIESRCNHGRTPLQWAMISWKENTEYVRPLLDKGADVTVKGKDGRTVLSLAIDKVYNVEIMDIIIERLDKADIDSRDNDGRTPFLLAAKKGDMRSMVLLLRKGADVQAKDKNGVSAMMHAALSRMKKSTLGSVISLLIETGIDVDSKDSDGRTPLSNLVSSCRSDKELQIVRLLLENGADINSTDNSGRSALSWASWNPTPGLHHLLIKRGADFNAKENSGETVLLQAIGIVDESISLLIE